MKHLDLFAGIAGFSHAAEPYGITTLFCEIDPACQQVIKYHFNGVPIVSDIRDLHGTQIEPVDVVTFGSPCQDMSVAGLREGISGERSGLFFEAIRIIREMREATHDLYPRYAVWENVPGAFTSHRGQDFRAVLEAFAESPIPMPGTRRWAPAGVVRGAGRSIAWRILDAQFWGVPQRRDRIYAVTDFRGQSAPEILFERQGVSGHSQEGREAGEEVARPITTGVGRWRGVENDQYVIAGFNGWRSTTGTLEYAEERAPAICETMPPNVTQCITTGTGRRYDPETETLIAQTITTNWGAGKDSATLVPVSFGPADSPDVSHAIRAGASRADKPDSTTYIAQGYRVRKLTPLEVLRCFGYPDTWLDIAGLSDTAKYRMCGNSIAIPCARFVMHRIAERIRQCP